MQTDKIKKYPFHSFPLHSYSDNTELPNCRAAISSSLIQDLEKKYI